MSIAYDLLLCHQGKVSNDFLLMKLKHFLDCTDNMSEYFELFENAVNVFFLSVVNHAHGVYLAS